MTEATGAAERDELTEFFVRYGEALATGDLPAISGCYVFPALVVTDRGASVKAAPKVIEADFDGAAERYRADGLVAARPTVLGAESLTDAVVSVDVHWDYCDDDGQSRARDGYRYVLRRTEAGPRIQVVIATPPA